MCNSVLCPTCSSLGCVCQHECNHKIPSRFINAYCDRCSYKVPCDLHLTPSPRVACELCSDPVIAGILCERCIDTLARFAISEELAPAWAVNRFFVANHRDELLDIGCHQDLAEPCVNTNGVHPASAAAYLVKLITTAVPKPKKKISVPVNPQSQYFQSVPFVRCLI
jgi:hypothetical protein